MTITLTNKKGFFIPVSKSETELLLREAISDIKKTGICTKNIVINKKSKDDVFLLEVGRIEENPPTNSFSYTSNIQKIRRGDCLINLVDQLEFLLKRRRA